MPTRASRICRPFDTFLAPRMPRVGAVLLATLFAIALGVLPAQAGAQNTGSADMQAVERYTLTMPKFDAWVAASKEIAESMKGKSEQERQDAATELDESASLDEVAAELDKVPEVHRAVRNARLTPREYLIINLVIVQAVMADEMLRQVPNAVLPEGISRANLEFVRANRAKIDARFQELKATGQDG